MMMIWRTLPNLPKVKKSEVYWLSTRYRKQDQVNSLELCSRDYLRCFSLFLEPKQLRTEALNYLLESILRARECVSPAEVVLIHSLVTGKLGDRPDLNPEPSAWEANMLAIVFQHFREPWC